MMKVLAVFFILMSSFIQAQTSEENLIKTAVNSLFEGMRTSDSVKINQAFSKTAILQTIKKNGEVKNENVKAFIASISKVQKGALDERITFSNILIDGNLASVWTPYEFYYQGKFSHCGVNSFQLVKTDNGWKIQYIIDTRRQDNCSK
jgi:hypothetical protein